MKNTIEQWFQEMPDGYRELAFKNYKRDKGDAYEDILQLKIPNLTVALMGAFGWEESEEGLDFWFDVCGIIQMEKWKEIMNVTVLMVI